MLSFAINRTLLPPGRIFLFSFLCYSTGVFDFVNLKPPNPRVQTKDDRYIGLSIQTVLIPIFVHLGGY